MLSKNKKNKKFELIDEILAYDSDEGIEYDDSYDYDAFVLDLEEYQSYLQKNDEFKKIKISKKEYMLYYKIRSKK